MQRLCVKNMSRDKNLADTVGAYPILLLESSLDYDDGSDGGGHM